MAGPPLTQYAAAVPCRVVVQQQIAQAEFPWSETVAWLTHDALTLNMPPWVRIDAQVYQYDYGGSDRLQLDGDETPKWMVLRREVITPIDGPEYQRVLICVAADIPVPPPPVPPPGPVGYRAEGGPVMVAYEPPVEPDTFEWRAEQEGVVWRLVNWVGASPPWRLFVGWVDPSFDCFYVCYPEWDGTGVSPFFTLLGGTGSCASAQYVTQVL